ncbi:uncharacterized protein [Equus caballus]|uniref:uncharacterized protein isoform X3 n=1 Tax=Equus caballus TaxID=9796 RepID=UPI0038B36E62
MRDPGTASWRFGCWRREVPRPCGMFSSAARGAKPIYAGWLLLAPDGTHLDNPVHRSRKWQWRFFILYKHGLLRYALDEMVWKDSPSDFWERGLLEISREGMMSPSTLTRASVRTTGESLFALQSWIISGKRKKDRQFSHLKVVNQNTSAG